MVIEGLVVLALFELGESLSEQLNVDSALGGQFDYEVCASAKLALDLD